MHWDYVAILFVLAVIVPWKGRSRVRSLLNSQSLESGERVALYVSTIAFQWAVSLLIAWRCFAHGLRLDETGLVFPDAARGIAATLLISSVLVLNQNFGVSRLARFPVEQRGITGRLVEQLLPRNSLERWTALALVLTVAICEEFIYRGFIQSLFQGTFHSLTLAAFISAAFFAAAHAYQGRRGLVTTFVAGLIFSGVRIWTNSLLPSMVIHFAVDFSAGIASIRLLLPERSK
jgi:uncharacterized protein